MKPRIHPYVSSANLARVRALATRPDQNESKVVDTALTAFFTQQKDDDRDVSILRRLDKLVGQFDRLERQNMVLGETLALYVRYFLTVTPQLPSRQLDSARAQGELQFDAFIEQLGRELQSGRRVLQRAVDEVMTDGSAFFTSAELDRLHEPTPARSSKKERDDA